MHVVVPWSDELALALARYPECIEIWREIAQNDENADSRRLARHYLRLAFDAKEVPDKDTHEENG